MLVSTAMVMLMTPGVALFYGGMVRSKNVLSTIMMSFMSLGVIGLLWVLYGYSLAFGTDWGGIIGGLDYVGLRNVGQAPSEIYASTVPHLSFMIFQMMFAVITVALITGAVVERMKFSAILVFSVLWFTIVYCPIAHWVWGSGGWLARLGALDFAGGMVVHISAGVSALAMAFLLGPRRGYNDGTPMAPHSIPLVVIGAGLLWFGWFGFNGGSALTSGGLATSTFVATNISAAAGAFTWMILSWYYRCPTVSGIVTGAVAGLGAITPVSGFISPIMGIPVGIIAAVLCYYCMLFRTKKKIDESLDVWAVHGIGGTWGTIAVGLFATVGVNSMGADGLFYGQPVQLLKQVAGVGAIWLFSFGMTWIIGKAINATMGLRVNETEETLGLDLSQHGERAYGGE
ncbi:MAG: ammonium transporter [Dehalococcoidales bacterium]|nr:ammonium transporter [Dehalococcoidales bacterium]